MRVSEWIGEDKTESFTEGSEIRDEEALKASTQAHIVSANCFQMLRPCIMINNTQWIEEILF